MNKILPFIFFFLVTRHVGVVAQSTSVYDQLVYVNAEWKNQPDVDISLKSLPATHLMEQQLVQQHLSEVEKLLRRRDISHLTFSQQQHRLENLEVLHQYQLTAKFPINNGHSNRQPYFIDASNNYCAVGYLMKMSGADEMARQISANENTNYLIDIHHPQMMNWVASSGLSIGELALIQPGYGHEWPACLVEMHYNNVGKDVNEYIEIHQSAGIGIGMRPFILKIKWFAKISEKILGNTIFEVIAPLLLVWHLKNLMIRINYC